MEFDALGYVRTYVCIYVQHGRRRYVDELHYVPGTR